ncbi:unnamed protein product [Closterium sp. NIES-64]|nr:unnamed protein product [Closterium sp. NIES-64]
MPAHAATCFAPSASLLCAHAATAPRFHGARKMASAAYAKCVKRSADPCAKASAPALVRTIRGGSIYAQGSLAAQASWGSRGGRAMAGFGVWRSCVSSRLLHTASVARSSVVRSSSGSSNICCLGLLGSRPSPSRVSSRRLSFSPPHPPRDGSATCHYRASLSLTISSSSASFLTAAVVSASAPSWRSGTHASFPFVLSAFPTFVAPSALPASASWASFPAAAALSFPADAARAGWVRGFGSSAGGSVAPRRKERLRIVDKTGGEANKALGIREKKKKKKKTGKADEKKTGKYYGEGFGTTGVPLARRWGDYDKRQWEDPEGWRGGILGRPEISGNRAKPVDSATMRVYKNWGRLEDGLSQLKALQRGDGEGDSRRGKVGSGGAVAEWGGGRGGGGGGGGGGGSRYKKKAGEFSWKPDSNDLQGARGVGGKDDEREEGRRGDWRDGGRREGGERGREEWGERGLRGERGERGGGSAWGNEGRERNREWGGRKEYGGEREFGGDNQQARQYEGGREYGGRKEYGGGRGGREAGEATGGRSPRRESGRRSWDDVDSARSDEDADVMAFWSNVDVDSPPGAARKGADQGAGRERVGGDAGRGRGGESGGERGEGRGGGGKGWSRDYAAMEWGEGEGGVAGRKAGGRAGGEAEGDREGFGEPRRGGAGRGRGMLPRSSAPGAGGRGGWGDAEGRGDAFGGDDWRGRAVGGAPRPVMRGGAQGRADGGMDRGGWGGRGEFGGRNAQGAGRGRGGGGQWGRGGDGGEMGSQGGREGVWGVSDGGWGGGRGAGIGPRGGVGGERGMDGSIQSSSGRFRRSQAQEPFRGPSGRGRFSDAEKESENDNNDNIDSGAEGEGDYDDGDYSNNYSEWDNSNSSWGTPSITPSALRGEPIYGVSPVLAALLSSRRRIHTLYTQEGLQDGLRGGGKRKDKAAVERVLRVAEQSGVERLSVSKHELNLLSGNRPHQGLVLDASGLQLEPIEALPVWSAGAAAAARATAAALGGAGAGEAGAEAGAAGTAAGPAGTGAAAGAGGAAVAPPVWVALDEVTDPQNLGAILRSAHFLGAAGVVVCAKNSAPLSAVVSKASAGALEIMQVHECSNMMRFLARSAANGWLVVGAAADPSAIPISRLSSGGSPTLLVLGSEGAGLRTNVKRACAHLVRISGAGFSGDVGGGVGKGGGVGEAAEEEGWGSGEEEGEGEREGKEGEVVAGAVKDGSGKREDGAGGTVGDVRGLGAGSGVKRGSKSGRLKVVDSLNVSVAAGILLHHLINSSVDAQEP